MRKEALNIRQFIDKTLLRNEWFRDKANIITFKGSALYKHFLPEFLGEITPRDLDLEIIASEDFFTKSQQEIMQFDLVLLPEELRNILPEDLQTDENKTDTNNGNTNGDNKETDYTPFIIAFVLGTIIFVVGYFFIQKKQKEVEPEDDDKINEELDDDCKKVLKILGENEGRMNQKEIRDILNFSETKMSLVVAELETVKKIKKIKKGRQNILKLIN